MRERVLRAGFRQMESSRFHFQLMTEAVKQIKVTHSVLMRMRLLALLLLSPAIILLIPHFGANSSYNRAWFRNLSYHHCRSLLEAIQPFPCARSPFFVKAAFLIFLDSARIVFGF